MRHDLMSSLTFHCTVIITPFRTLELWFINFLMDKGWLLGLYLLDHSLFKRVLPFAVHLEFLALPMRFSGSLKSKIGLPHFGFDFQLV